MRWDMKSRNARRYLLGILVVILAFNYVDRQALALVLQDIKSDLHLTDTQLGLLTGVAFALFYSLMGIPIARWADRGNRVAVISTAVAVWSAAVALCAVAGNFAQLLLIRVGVAIGEAGCIPPANSLISDHFDRSERPRALATYMLGIPLSALFGYFLAGWLNEIYGWRVTFVVLGAPGIVLAALAWFTLADPRFVRGATRSAREPDEIGMGQRKIPQPPAAQPTLKQIVGRLYSSVTFRHILMGFSVTSFFAYGIGQWLPAFFIRSFGLQTGELGIWLALIQGLGGLLGTYWGGQWALRHAKNNECLQLKVMAAGYTACGVIFAGVCLCSGRYAAFGLLTLAIVGGSTVSGPLFGTIQTLVPQGMRAVAVALVYLFANLIGGGLGPLAVGFLSDTFRLTAGEESLRYALLLLTPGYLWGAWHLWRGSITVMRDLESAQCDSGFSDAGREHLGTETARVSSG